MSRAYLRQEQAMKMSPLARDDRDRGAAAGEPERRLEDHGDRRERGAAAQRSVINAS
jgi:hypothetical protein